MTRFQLPAAWLPALLLTALGLVCPGCSTTQARPEWIRKLTFWDKDDVDPRGALAPWKRIENMRELAEKIPDESQPEQQKHAAELAEAFRNEPDGLVRMQILRTIALCGSPEAGETLQAGLKDSDRDVRIVACDVWGVHQGPQALPLLAEVIRKDPSTDVRLAAMRAVGKLGDPNTVELLAPCLEDPNPAMQYRAVQSLRQVTGKDFGDDANAWRDFVKGGDPKPISMVQRMKLDWK